MTSRRLLHVLTVALALVLVGGASGEPINEYTATSAPTHVKPSTQRTYTIALTNSAVSSREADRAKIGIPAGFTVTSVTATTNAAGACVASTWVADGTLIADGKINLKRGSPSGGTNSRLCPGATLTVAATATSAAIDGAHVWATELLRDQDAFLLGGPQPPVVVDGTAPVVTLTSQPANPTNATSASFGFSANETASFECKLDGEAFAACSSPKAYANLGDGSHTFTVRATDAAANTGTASSTWLVETTKPVVTLTGKPNSASSSANASFTFTSSKPSTFECKLDGGSYASCTSPHGYAGLADGPHTFSVRATDGVGNVGPDSTHTWTVDTASPVATIGEKPANPSNDASPTFAFSANEAVTFQCKLDAQAFTACVSPKVYAAADGAHTFTVRATDAAGNTGEDSYSWTIDTVAPSVQITQKPGSPTGVPAPTFEFAANESAAFECKLDAGAFAGCSSPKSYPAVPDGPHTFTVRATDAAGNTGNASHTWTVDTVAPTVTLTQKPSNPSSVTSPTFAFSASEGATFQCKLDAGAFTGCSSPKSYFAVPDGPHTFAVRAIDAAGNAGETGYEWLIETKLAIVTIASGPAGVTRERSASFVFQTRPGASVECRLDAAQFAPCPSPRTYDNLADGRHTFTARATDHVGAGPPTTYSWTVDATGPAVAVTQAPGDPTNSRSAALAFSASEAATFKCKLDDAALVACTSPQAYENLADGRHTFVVIPTDALGNVGAAIAHSWTIDTRAPAVSVAEAPPGLTNSTGATVTFGADEPSTFQCNLDDRGFEPCSSPTAYGGLRDGGHSFVVRSTDAAGNVGAASRAWTVDATAPETTLVPSVSAASATFAFRASEPATFECQLDGSAFAPCTSPASYRLATGAHQFAVRSVDAAGNVDATPALYRWTVGAAVRRVTRSALLAPRAGARVTRPPLLRWRPVRGATYYNVQLYRGSRKVLTAWPTRAALQLRGQWRFGGRVQRLTPGAYRWYVWPGYGRPSARRYGQVLGTGTFVVTRAARR